MAEKFAHYRLWADNTIDATWLPRGGVTICYEEVENEYGNVIKWGAAVCAPEDNFCKATGRTKAHGRLKMKSLPAKYLFMKGFFNPGGATKADTEIATKITLDGIAVEVFQRMMELRLDQCGMSDLAIPSFTLARKYGVSDGLFRRANASRNIV